MAKELMWVCALLPAEFDRRIAALCKDENKSIGLPEDVFRFPLHISMKKSFQTTEFAAVKGEILRYIQSKGKIQCTTGAVICCKKMLWVPVEPTGDIKAWHDGLDQMLLDKFAVPIHRFDAAFEPHISLFTKGTQAQMEEMQPRLSRVISPMDLTLNRFVIGSSGHKDEFFEV